MFSTSIKNKSEKIFTLPYYSICISHVIFFFLLDEEKGHYTEDTEGKTHGQHSSANSA
jgi:hypothetical protein